MKGCNSCLLKKIFISFAFFFIFLLISIPDKAQPSVNQAVQFTFNIISFFNWSTVPGDKIIVNVYSDDISYNKAFQNFIGNKTIQNKKIEIVPIKTITEANGQVLVVCNSGVADISAISHRKILIIGLGTSIAQGADIEILNSSYKINEQNLKNKGYQYSHELINYAVK